MTSVDVIGYKKDELIYATAMHEYIHAYFTKSSLYGNSLVDMRLLNVKLDCFGISSGKQETLQEFTVTLAEFIYIYRKYKYSYQQLTPWITTIGLKCLYSLCRILAVYQGEFYLWKAYFQSHFLVIKKGSLFLRELVCDLAPEIMELFGFHGRETILSREAFHLMLAPI